MKEPVLDTPILGVNAKTSQSLKNYWETTSERKREQSERMKGDNNIAKRPEIRQKISMAKRGKKFKTRRPLSERRLRHLKKLAEMKIGKPKSIETRKKISKSKKGTNCGSANPFFGKTHPQEIIEKIREANKIKHKTHLAEVFEKASKLGIHPSKRFDRHPALQINLVIDPLAFILGTIPTDAYFGIPPSVGYYVYHIAVKDFDFIKWVKICLDKLNIPVKINKRKNGDLWYIRTTKKAIEQFIPYLEKQKGWQWIYSGRVFNQNTNFKKSLLIAVCDAEGCATYGNAEGKIVSRHITVTNSTRMLLTQIEFLLNCFRIRSYTYLHRLPRKAKIKNEICHFKRKTYTLNISGCENLLKFKKNIGFTIKRKQKKLEEMLTSYKIHGLQYTEDDYTLVMNASRHFPICMDISKLTGLPVHTIRNWILHEVQPRSLRGEV